MIPGSANRPATRGTRATAVVLALAMALMVLALYTFLHESGHALLGVLFGGRLHSFSANFWDLSAHVGIDAGYSAGKGSLVALAGTSLPLLVLALLLARVPRMPSATLEYVRAVATVGVLSTVLPWLIIPFLYLAGQAPADDVTNFLRLSRLPPLGVAAGALVVFVGGWAFFFSRAGGMRALCDRWRRSLPDLLAAGSLHDFRLVAGLGLAAMVIAAGAGRYFERTNPLDAPAGYRGVAVIDLTERRVASSRDYVFTLAQPGEVSLFFVLQNIKAGPVEIALVGPGLRTVFFSAGANAGIGRATVNPKKLLLQPGEYYVEWMFPRQTGGKVAAYVSGPELQGLP